MRKHHDYIPHHKEMLNAWAGQFVRNETENVGHYSITEADVQQTKAIAEAFEASLAKEIQLTDLKRAQVEITKQLRKKLITNIRAMAQKIKSSADYATDVGKEFDIIGAEKTFDHKTWKPTLKLRKAGNGGVSVAFTKSNTHGVNLYRRRSGQEQFEFLSRSTHSPFHDTKDITSPAHYEYYAVAVISDKETGKESGIAQITV